MPLRNSSKTKQLLCTISEVLEEQKDGWTHFFIGTLDPRYKRFFYAGGIDAVHRRLGLEQLWKRNALLRKLEQQKLIHVQRISSRLRLTLTEKGRRALIKEKLLRANPCKKDECVIVVFDIPERAKEIRRQFRLLLKECRFQQVQKSVWMSRRDVLPILQEFTHLIDGKEWIRSFRAFDIE